MQVDSGILEHASGRRRITQLSKAEWREALQQQIHEKQQRQQQRQPGGCDDRTSDQRQTCVPSSSNQHDEYQTQANPGAPPAALPHVGRRGARPMSNVEWRAALEQQIREREESNALKTNTSASNDDQIARATTATLASPLAVDCSNDRTLLTTAPTVTTNENLIANTGGRRRRQVSQMTREDYLKSLEEQIQAKKVREQATSDSTHRREEVSTCEEPTIAPACDVQQKLPSPMPAAHSLAEANPNVTTTTGDPTGGALSENLEAPLGQPPSTAAVDSAAFAKLFEFCEDMRQQNDELKRQLLAQHTTLATLASTLADNKAPPSRTKEASLPQRKGATTLPSKGGSTPSKVSAAQTSRQLNQQQKSHSRIDKPSPELPVVAQTPPSDVGTTKIPRPRITRRQSSYTVPLPPLTSAAAPSAPLPQPTSPVPVSSAGPATRPSDSSEKSKESPDTELGVQSPCHLPLLRSSIVASSPLPAELPPNDFRASTPCLPPLGRPPTSWPPDAAATPTSSTRESVLDPEPPLSAISTLLATASGPALDLTSSSAFVRVSLWNYKDHLR